MGKSGAALQRKVTLESIDCTEDIAHVLPFIFTYLDPNIFKKVHNLNSSLGKTDEFIL